MALRSIRVVQLSPESASKRAWLAEADAAIVAGESSFEGAEEADSAWILPSFVDGVETDFILDDLRDENGAATLAVVAPLPEGTLGLDPEIEDSVLVDKEKASLWRKTRDFAKDAVVASIRSLFVRIIPLTVKEQT